MKPFVMTAFIILVAGCGRDMAVDPASHAARSGIYSGAHVTSPEATAGIVHGAARLTGAPVVNANVVHVPLFIETTGGQPPTSPDAPLFEVRKHNPILAPDGHQITLAEFNRVAGWARVKCVGE